MSVHTANPAHEVAYQDICALMKKHADQVGSLELLAIAANMVGKIVALQDQRKVTPDMALKVVAVNLEQGNLDALAQVLAAAGTAQ